MKISKSLLTAIAAGLLITSTTSCDKAEFEDTHLSTCDEDCTINHEEIAKHYPCAACGMG